MTGRTAAKAGTRDAMLAAHKQGERAIVMPALRFVAICALLTALMYAWGEGYSSGWRKPFEVVIRWRRAEMTRMSCHLIAVWKRHSAFPVRFSVHLCTLRILWR